MMLVMQKNIWLCSLNPIQLCKPLVMQFGCITGSLRKGQLVKGICSVVIELCKLCSYVTIVNYKLILFSLTTVHNCITCITYITKRSQVDRGTV